MIEGASRGGARDAGSTQRIEVVAAIVENFEASRFLLGNDVDRMLERLTAHVTGFAVVKHGQFAMQAIEAGGDRIGVVEALSPHHKPPKKRA